MTTMHLGMNPGELDGKPYARHWNPTMAPLSDAAREAILVGPVAGALLPPLADARRLLEPGDQPLEDGYGLTGGALHVAVRTVMPGVTPAMIDWWFGWHGEEPERYKLWHPRAHVHASWTDATGDRAGRAAYLGRTSVVHEYVGSELASVHIRFVHPAQLGLDDARLGDATAVCARIGYAAQPLDFGWLLHHVRPVAGGAEMRSRFWIGGPHAAVRGLGRAGTLAARVVGRVLGPSERNGHDLLVHCAQEMAHLASFLPALHAEHS
jgi:hypothetical protein